MSLPLVGYADRLVAAPGERVRVMVSCERPSFGSRLVRLGAGPERPHGPGFGERDVPGVAAGVHPGRVQALRPGSYVVVDEPPALGPASAFVACAWLWPTLPGRGEQAVLALGEAFALVLGADGDLELRLGGQRLRHRRAAARARLELRGLRRRPGGRERGAAAAAARGLARRARRRARDRIGRAARRRGRAAAAGAPAARRRART